MMLVLYLGLLFTATEERYIAHENHSSGVGFSRSSSEVVLGIRNFILAPAMKNPSRKEVVYANEGTSYWYNEIEYFLNKRPKERSGKSVCSQFVASNDAFKKLRMNNTKSQPYQIYWYCDSGRCNYDGFTCFLPDWVVVTCILLFYTILFFLILCAKKNSNDHKVAELSPIEKKRETIWRKHMGHEGRCMDQRWCYHKRAYLYMLMKEMNAKKKAATLKKAKENEEEKLLNITHSDNEVKTSIS